ncbi:MAG: single-stranded DNA-binding protein [Verrucomicrobia bacterium]|nr:single-stranded DNA-binding protein [Kiritimatiellia bacterium]MCO6400427.1 single-stranded DNA-binding protein [Verrucomicrobiota bacterium]
MASFNRVMLIGRLTRDPEKRTISSGSAVTEFRLAASRRFKSSSGEDREETVFVDIAAWGRTAEICAQYLRKGSQVFVEGRLKLDEWEKDGQKRSKLSVVAEAVQFLDSKGSGDRDRDGGGAPVYEGDSPRENSSRPRSQPSAAPTAPADERDSTPSDDDLPF